MKCGNTLPGVRRAARRCGSLLWLSLLLAATALAPGTSQGANRSNLGRRPLAGSVVASPGAQEVRTLEQAKPTAREMAGGQSHDYRVELAADQYLSLVVEQRGVDVAVRLFAPGGEKLIEIDGLNGAQGPEPMSFIAAAPGSYRVQVSALEESAAPGRYEVRVQELRSVTAEEKVRIATDAEAAADKIYEQHTAEAGFTAASLYEQVLLMWQAVGNLPKQVGVLNTLGNIHRMIFVEGDQVDLKSITYYERALPLAKAAGDSYGEARSLFNIANYRGGFGEYQLAIDYLNQALLLIQAMGNQKRESAILRSIGGMYDSLGETQKGLDCYFRALEVSRAAQDFDEQAEALDTLHLFYGWLKDREKAYYYVELLLSLYGDAKRPLDGGKLFNVGLTYSRLGEWNKGLGFVEQALTEFHARSAPFGEAAALTEIGVVQHRLGDSRKALDSLEAAVTLLRKFPGEGNTGFRLGMALLVMGKVYSDTGDQEKALEFYQQAFTLVSIYPYYEAILHAGIARSEYRRGNFAAALPHIEAALKFFESFRAKLSSQDLRVSHFASVADEYQLYIDLLMRLHKQSPAKGFDVKALQASERARARSLLELLAESGADIRRGVDPALLERERALQRQMAAKEARLTQLQSSQRPPEQLVAAVRKEFEELLIQSQELQGIIRLRSPHYAALTQPQPLNPGELQSRVLDSETLLLEYSLGDDASYLWAVTTDSVHSYELPRRSVIQAAAQRVYELLTARNLRPKEETPDGRRERIRRADAEYPAAAADLSRLVLGPVAAQLGHKRLLIVADGALQFVPFAALPEPAAAQRGQAAAPPLVVEHELVYLPSASTLAVLRSEGRRGGTATKTVAVLADPVFDKDDPRVQKTGAALGAARVSPAEDNRRLDILRAVNDTGEQGPLPRLSATRWEAEKITSLIPKGEAMLAVDFAASRSTVTGGELGRYRIVHFATHALIDSVQPELSGLVLSLVDERGRPQDGFIRAHELFNLDLPVELVVLSACRTGLGKDVRGEGLMGLTRGFMYAGAPRVAVSLWSVSDRPTAELMSLFYEKMLGEKRLPPATALRAAQIMMWKSEQWRHPYFWAGFSLQGDWN